MRRPGAGPPLDWLPRRRRILLLLDFDGTLCEIRPNPRRARLSPPRLSLLEGLSRSGVLIAVVSGRPAADLPRLVPVPGVIYGGNYGLDVRAGAWRFLHPSARASRKAVSALRRRLAVRFRDVPGVLIEDKGAGLGVHYRNVPRSRLDDFMSRWRTVQAEATPRGLRWEAGRDAWEVRPDCRWGKGSAALLLWKRLGRPYPIAIGDAASDEEMFAAVAGKGMALHVGSVDLTKARFRLKDVAHVYAFLRRLKDRLEPAAR